jgi:vacuolar-type H+-ATPase subunit H
MVQYFLRTIAALRAKLEEAVLMNEKRIREVIEIEKQAEEMLAAAKHEAEQLPIHAEAEAGKVIEQARASAKEDAGKILEQARAGGEAAEILSKTKVRMGEAEKLADVNLEKAVNYVLERVTGRA